MLPPVLSRHGAAAPTVGVVAVGGRVRSQVVVPRMGDVGGGAARGGRHGDRAFVGLRTCFCHRFSLAHACGVHDVFGTVRVLVGHVGTRHVPRVDLLAHARHGHDGHSLVVAGVVAGTSTRRGKIGDVGFTHQMASLWERTPVSFNIPPPPPASCAPRRWDRAWRAAWSSALRPKVPLTAWLAVRSVVSEMSSLSSWDLAARSASWVRAVVPSYPAWPSDSDTDLPMSRPNAPAVPLMEAARLMRSSFCSYWALSRNQLASIEFPAGPYRSVKACLTFAPALATRFHDTDTALLSESMDTPRRMRFWKSV